MKLVYLILFLLIFQEAFPQTLLTIEGKVTDKATNLPLAYVNIRVAGTSFGTVTNQAGNFMLRYQASEKEDTVLFSYLGYQPFRMSLKNGQENNLVVSLEPQPLNLKEVVVKPLDPLDVVYNCINKIPENYNLNPHTVQGFQREYVKQAGHFIQLLEAAFETKATGPEAVPVSSLLDARYIEDQKEKAPLWNPARGGFYTFGWTAVSGMENPSKSNFLGVNVKKKRDLSKYYTFQWKESIKSDNQDLYVIAFDQKQNVRQPLLKGTLYIDAESEAIVKIVYQLSPRGIKYLKPHETWGGQKVSKYPKRIDIKNDRHEITYRKYGSKWYLNTYVMDTEFDASLVFFRLVQAQKNSLAFHSERIVTAIDTTADANDNPTTNIGEVGSIPTLQNFIKKNFENYDEVGEEKWANVNFIRSDTSIAAVAKQLKLNNQEWESQRKQQVLEKAMARSLYTSRQLTEDVDYLQETLEKVHPGLYWYTDKSILDAEFKKVKNQLKKKNTEAEFFQLLSPVVEKIHCGHTELSPSLIQSEYQKLYQGLFPLSLYIKGDTAVVTTSYNNIRKGERVMAINGHEISEITNRIKAGVAADGYNQTYKEYLLNHQFPLLFARHFPGKGPFEVKMEGENGQVKEVKIEGKTENEERSKPMAGAKLLVYDSLQTAVLTLPSFMTDQDLPEFFQNSFAEMGRREIKSLILDLRNNQGGKDEYGRLLFSYLAQAPFQYYKSISVATRDTAVLSRLTFGEDPFASAVPDYLSQIREENGSFSYTAHANLGWHQPKEEAFKGSVYILINGGIFSAAAEFAAIAHHHNRAVFVGEETGGGYYGNSSLGTPTLTLPNSQIRMTVPLAKFELAVSKSVPFGKGVIPDYPTSYYPSDILQNRDKDLALCLRLIREQRNIKK